MMNQGDLMIMIIITILFRWQVYLAGQGPTNWGDYVFTTLRWTETFHTTDVHT